MRTVAVITGTRAEYGILKPVIEKIQDSAALQLSLIVTGMHLSPQHGMTVNEIKRDDFPIAAKVDMQISSESGAAMAVSAGIGIQELSKTINQIKPDIVMVLGDRIEAFAGAVAGLFCGCVVAHIHGGDVTQGGLDEYMRHAITKLSHIHFAATPKSKERILRLGEPPDYVFHTGTPGLDAIMQFPPLSLNDINMQLQLNLPEQFALAVQHPVSTHPDTAGDEMQATLSALHDAKIHCVLVYPNADAGSAAMMDVITRYEKENWLNTFASLPRHVFCGLLRQTAFLIGNSSSGMIDAPAYGTPVINIGERQEGRERGTNVIDVPPKKDAIAKAVETCLHNKNFIAECRKTQNPYGDGKASMRIVEMLEQIDLNDVKSAKKLPY